MEDDSKSSYCWTGKSPKLYDLPGSLHYEPKTTENQRLMFSQSADLLRVREDLELEAGQSS